MRLSQVSIDRPVLASVMSLVIVLFGWIGATRLPNRELPDVDPPVVSVTTVFPGAAPEVVETSVTQPLEDLLVGVEGVKHITSTSREQVSQISVEFTLDRDVEAAANDVRDRVSRVRSQRHSTNASQLARPMVKAGNRIWNETTKPNWIRDSNRASTRLPPRRDACAGRVILRRSTRPRRRLAGTT